MMWAGGFVDVDDLLQLHQFKGFNLTDIQRVVSNCSKQRFFLKQDPITHKTYIRANQGHTLEVSGKFTCVCVIRIAVMTTCTELELQPITSAAEVPTVVHGTYKDVWDSIKRQVLLYCVGTSLTYRIVYVFAWSSGIK